MNEKFFRLSQEKQEKIINSAMKVFSLSGYYQTSTLEIAREAGISKGLLFHYFKNKKELYLFLYEYCVKLVLDEIESNRNSEESDFFELLLKSMQLKCNLMKKFRYLYEFLIKVYIENDEEIKAGILQRSEPMVDHNYKDFFDRIDTGKFKEGVDVPLLFQSLQWCADGFMRNAFSTSQKIDEIVLEFTRVLELHKRYYYKEEYLCSTTNMETGKTIQ